MRPAPLLAGFLLLVAAAPAVAAPSYSVAFWNGGYYLGSTDSSTPLYRSASYELAPSNGTGFYTGRASAGPGFANATGRVDCTWSGGFSGAFSGRTDARTAAYDLVVTGPPSPANVSGTLNLRVRVSLDRVGGYAANNGHSASFTLNASTLYSGASGSIVSGNYNTTGSGCFSGITSPSVDLIVPLTGNYPVNVPFTINLAVYASGATYGNASVNPGMTECDAGGAYEAGANGVCLEAVNGQVMSLPAGYSFGSASWGIVNNAYPGPLAVGEPATRGGFGLRIAGANPASGPSRLALTLERDGRARVIVCDASGRTMQCLLDGPQAAGRHELSWDGRGADGTPAPPGLYFVRAEAGGERRTLRIARIR